MTLIDGQGRIHDYMRVSITDRCNLRCIYCMKEDGIKLMRHRDILSYEEIVQVVKASVELGITRIRITGGEPLARKNISDLISAISAFPQIEDISMTTNGILLPPLIKKLKAAGLSRINISLDSLKEDNYRKITRCGNLGEALAGIDAALDNQLNPVKVNVVLMKGINDREILDFIELSFKKPLHIRFIEYMPIGENDPYYSSHYLPVNFVKEVADKNGLTLTPAPLPGGAGPAESYTIKGCLGTIGLIHPISKHFCNLCNRLRLTADGKLKACLYWQEESSVRPYLNNHQELIKLIEQVLSCKPAEHKMLPDGRMNRADHSKMRAMYKTGG